VKGYLFDENLPNRVRFHPSLPVFHARDLGEAATDSELWEYAKAHDLVIVTKDADFSDRMMASDPPPRVIHLRIGNLRRQAFHEFLERVWPRLETLLESNKLINVYLNHFETISIE
jgi:predicted nuclease of predicted toxin-antitoxin system